MANKSVFASTIGKLLPRANAWNREKAPAYGLEPRAALAQLAATGTFNRTFYAEPREQLAEIVKLARFVDSATGLPHSVQTASATNPRKLYPHWTHETSMSKRPAASRRTSEVSFIPAPSRAACLFPPAR